MQGVPNARLLGDRDGVWPEALAAVASRQSPPYSVEIGWAGPDADDRFDVLLRRGVQASGEREADFLADVAPAYEAALRAEAQRGHWAGLSRLDHSGWRAFANAPTAARFRRTLPRLLRQYLLTKLPDYMVPSVIAVRTAWPLTPNGKVDRRGLPAPEGCAYATPGYAAPVGAVEEALAAIWAEVLGVERVGRQDDFFALGGHSLLAVRVMARVRQRLGFEVTVRDVFQYPVLAELARAVAQAQRVALPPIESVARSATGEPLAAPALSFAQERLWFLEQLGGLGATYHVPWRLRLRGALDAGALRRALDRIVARHEAWRTTLVAVDGVPRQVIQPAAASQFALTEHDLTAPALGGPAGDAALWRLVDAETQVPFDLARGPLVRGRLIRLGATEHVLLLTMHHVVSDGWSAGIFLNELSALYGAYAAGGVDPLPAVAVQYADYAVWQRTWVSGAVLAAQAAYGRATLRGARVVLMLPTDRPRPAEQDYAGGAVGVVWAPALTAGVKGLSLRAGTTLFQTVLAGWAFVLSRLAGLAEVVIGTPTATRGRAAMEGVIGFCVNSLALPVE